jgi:hypothetical protein
MGYGPLPTPKIKNTFFDQCLDCIAVIAQLCKDYRIVFTKLEDL